MDQNNYDLLKSIAPHERLYLMRDFDPQAQQDKNVPDPYYGKAEGFKDVYDMLYRADNGLLDHIETERGLKREK